MYLISWFGGTSGASCLETVFFIKVLCIPLHLPQKPREHGFQAISLCTGAAGAEIFLPELQGLLKPMALQVRRLKGM